MKGRDMLLKNQKNGRKVINFRNIQEVNKMMQNSEKLIITDPSGNSIEEVMDLAKKSRYKVKSFNLKN